MIPYIIVRVARIVSFNRLTGRCSITYTDDSGSEFSTQAILPQPLAVGEGGIFVEPVEGAQVLVDLGPMNQPYIISYLPELFFNQFLTLNNSTSLSSNFLTRPAAEPGEVTIKGFGNTYTRYLQSGDIQTRFGTSTLSLDSSNIFSLKADSSVHSLQSGYSVSGVVRRELSGPASNLLDKLSDPEFNVGLSDVGRNPGLASGLKSGSDPKTSSARRNPPFVEARSVVYEFARDFSAADPQTENQLYTDSSVSVYNLAEERQGARTDALGLSPLQHNVLFESIVGTVVDVDGKVLDLNRVSLGADAVSEENSTDKLYQLLRRSIKLHLELNSRKDIKPDALSTDGSYPDALETIAGHSRWSIDVDAEGQTKVNIPASSQYGNIPVNARYLPSSYFKTDISDSDRTSYEKNRIGTETVDGNRASDDISLLNFNLGSAGIPIIDAPGSKNKSFVWNMPYHDFTFADILSREAFFYPGATLGSPLEKNSRLTYAQRLSGLNTENPVPEQILTAMFLSNGQFGNAGGRSLHMNLDGSAELSLGADQADGKSFCFDAAGSGIIRFGKDKKDRSLVVGADGDMVMMIGASRRANDDEEISGASLQIFVEGTSGVSSIQIIDGNVVIKGAPNKNVIIESAGNLVMNAGKHLMLGGERIYLFGKYGEDGQQIAGEREISRSGNKVI